MYWFVCTKGVFNVSKGTIPINVDIIDEESQRGGSKTTNRFIVFLDLVDRKISPSVWRQCTPEAIDLN